MEGLISSRIGHFSANTELYLCERDAGINLPSQKYVDIFYNGLKPICNHQLLIMWRRVLHIWPAWIVRPINRINRIIPGGKVHQIGQNTQDDRDVHNLLDRFPAHLKFTTKEESRGESGLRAMGIPLGRSFICLAVRDSDYLAMHLKGIDFSYHNYRDCDIKNFVLATKALVDRGYYVIRMGAKVHAAMNFVHPQFIDYAFNGMRNDFMDIFLGARCAFFLSTGMGWDAVPAWLFRRPGIYANLMPLGYIPTFSNKFLLTSKRHFRKDEMQELSLSEIFSLDVGFCMTSADYESRDVCFIENTSEEIRDVVLEMVERLAGNWLPHPDDDALQQKFWTIFPTHAVDVNVGKPLHGKICARFSAAFLRNNLGWLQ
jgi:putative glycosyltransferase (TIGR04372 family)